MWPAADKARVLAALVRMCQRSRDRVRMYAEAELDLNGCYAWRGDLLRARGGLFLLVERAHHLSEPVRRMLLELPAPGSHGSRAVARTERKDVCAVPVRSGMPGALSRCKSGVRFSDMGVQGWALLRILVDELRHVPQRCDGLYHRSAVSPLQPRSAIWSSRGLGSRTTVLHRGVHEPFVLFFPN